MPPQPDLYPCTSTAQQHCRNAVQNCRQAEREGGIPRWRPAQHGTIRPLRRRLDRQLARNERTARQGDSISRSPPLLPRLKQQLRSPRRGLCTRRPQKKSPLIVRPRGRHAAAFLKRIPSHGPTKSHLLNHVSTVPTFGADQ